MKQEIKSEITEKIYLKFSKYPKRIYPKGHTLIYAGEKPSDIFYIISGRVREYDVSDRGDDVIINVFQTPAFFPMSAAINQTDNKYFYKTETKTELHIVPTLVAVDFVHSNPDVMLDLLSRVYRGTDELLGRIVHLMSGSASSRLIYELIITCRKNSNDKIDFPIKLNISEIDLAARTGLTRETISREIHKLKVLKLVEVTNKVIIINDLSALEIMLGSEI